MKRKQKKNARSFNTVDKEYVRLIESLNPGDKNLEGLKMSNNWWYRKSYEKLLFNISFILFFYLFNYF